MPSATSRSALTRQWELLKLLPSKAPGFTAAQLQVALADAGYKTSKRTIERDLIELSRLFPLHCNDKGTPFGWYWTPGQSAELPGISLSEALTLRLVEGSIRPLIPAFMLKTLEPRFNLARQKLAALSDDNNSARWLDKVGSVQPEMAQLPPEIKSEQLEVIQQALLNEQQLSCSYYSAHRNQTSQLTLNPLALVQRGHTTYLIATAEPFDDIRQFVLHRFADSQQLTSPCIKPEGFNLSRYIDSGAMQFGNLATINFHAWITDGLARLIRETPIASDMQLREQDGGFDLTATVNDSWELRWWVLSHAGSIVVHAPQALRDEITERLERGAKMHRPD